MCIRTLSNTRDFRGYFDMIQIKIFPPHRYLIYDFLASTHPHLMVDISTVQTIRFHGPTQPGCW